MLQTAQYFCEAILWQEWLTFYLNTHRRRVASLIIFPQPNYTKVTKKNYGVMLPNTCNWGDQMTSFMFCWLSVSIRYLISNFVKFMSGSIHVSLKENCLHNTCYYRKSWVYKCHWDNKVCSFPFLLYCSLYLTAEPE
jgi:hypothetical protein